MEEEGREQNRLFVILAVSLIGLLVLGLLGVGGVFVIRQNLQQQEVASRPTPTLIIRLPAPTNMPVPQSMQPTNTPEATPTSTPVVVPGSGEEASVGGSPGKQNTPWPTRTPVAPGAETAATQTVPETGLGAFELVLIAAGLIAVFFVARRMRMAS